MALPSTGQISMSQINTELGRSSTATISLNSAEDGSYTAINTCSSSRPSSTDPASMSEWYSYNHGASCGGGVYDLYVGQVYSCADCSLVEVITLAFPAGTSVVLNRFYLSATEPWNGYVYKATMTTSGGPGYIVTTPFYTTCAIACANAGV